MLGVIQEAGFLNYLQDNADSLSIYPGKTLKAVNFAYSNRYSNREQSAYFAIETIFYNCSDVVHGSDHKVVACYIELYEEGEVKHINGV